MNSSDRHSANIALRICVLQIFMFSFFFSFAQQNVFQLFQDDVKKGDEYFNDGSYRHALQVYKNHNGKLSPTINLRIARCYYRLHDYTEGVRYFEKASLLTKMFDPADRFMFAEALASTGSYTNAIQQYQQYLEAIPEDELVRKKIWRLKNIQFLFEDSLHFSVRKLPMSSEFDDFGAVPFDRGVVFLSNRKGAGRFDKSDAMTGEHVFRIYYTSVVPNGGGNFFNGYSKTTPFKGLDAKFQNGSVAFYDNYTKAVFVKSGEKAGGNVKKTLQLFFAEWQGRSWKETRAFPFNSEAYNITGAYISADGHVLYFSSDMAGGFGGLDLYKSKWENGAWSKPVNLGPEINTRLDESFPHIYRDVLYFSSNGHAGMGALDVFKATILEDGFGEVLNPGFPINSHGDDFAFFFREDGDGAYLTSNRNSATDDLYEIEIDLQSYPVVISGTLKMRDFSYTDSARLEVLPNSKMLLVDHDREIIVDEVVTDDEGHFQLRIPYFSQFKIKVMANSGFESIVSLQIPRQKKADYNHEIVVVKDAFHTPKE